MWKLGCSVLVAVWGGMPATADAGEEIRYVLATKLRLRSSLGRSYKVRAKLRIGTPLEVGDCTDGFCQVATQGLKPKTGYVSEQLLSKKQPIYSDVSNQAAMWLERGCALAPHSIDCLMSLMWAHRTRGNHKGAHEIETRLQEFLSERGSRLGVSRHIYKAEDYHGHQSRLQDGTSVLALCGNTLSRETLSVKTVYDRGAESNDGKRLSVSCEARAIFAGFDFPEGEVAEAKMSPEVRQGRRTTTSFRLGQTQAELRVTPTVTRSPMIFIPSEVRWKYGKRSQILQSGWLDKVTVVWAGDLNGDQKIDLIVEISPEYNVSWLRLFVSDKSGKLMQMADHWATGC